MLNQHIGHHRELGFFAIHSHHLTLSLSNTLSFVSRPALGRYDFDTYVCINCTSSQPLQGPGQGRGAATTARGRTRRGGAGAEARNGTAAAAAVAAGEASGEQVRTEP